ncbi:MAG TPA: RHS repeat-associated core domain-containing protein, partial [Acidimicrobiia bacterium]|nr:RHS repeat-associated core domain-containing protein [Acidimicrobiia bacterium]
SAQGTYTYDTQGNRLSARPPTAPVATYTYDQLNRLKSFAGNGTSAQYAYNGDGLRMAKTVATTKTTSTGTRTTTKSTPYAWDVTASPALPLMDGNLFYVYGPGGLPIEQIQGTSVMFYSHDQLGSTTMLTDNKGVAKATFTYSAYGQPFRRLGTTTPALLFAGQYRDAESNLYYLRSRYYDPTTAQFLSVDPLVSQTATPYGYASGNPINVVDPTGMCGKPASSNGSDGWNPDILQPAQWSESTIQEQGWSQSYKIPPGYEVDALGPAYDSNGYLRTDAAPYEVTNHIFTEEPHVIEQNGQIYLVRYVGAGPSFFTSPFYQDDIRVLPTWTEFTQPAAGIGIRG